jgi:hypothetical protein
MAREQVGEVWVTVCYTCPARTRTSEGPICDERNIGQIKSNGSKMNRPLYCPKNNGQGDGRSPEDLLRRKFK